MECWEREHYEKNINGKIFNSRYVCFAKYYIRCPQQCSFHSSLVTTFESIAACVAQNGVYRLCRPLDGSQ